MPKIPMPEGWKQWNLEATLGKGTFGAVYRATKTIGGETLESAIKVIMIPDSESRENEQIAACGSKTAARLYFRQIADGCLAEISAMSAMKSAGNIVNIEDFALIEQESGVGWMVFIRMELLTCFSDSSVFLRFAVGQSPYFVINRQGAV